MKQKAIQTRRTENDRKVFDKWKDKLPKDTIERTLAIEGNKAEPTLKAIYNMWRSLEKGKSC